MSTTLTTGIGGWIPARADVQPDALMMVFEGHRISWGRFGREVEQIAAGLLANSVKPGDRVACLLGNCPLYLELFWACARIGAIFCPINVRLAPPEFALIIDDLEPALVISEASFDHLLDALPPHEMGGPLVTKTDVVREGERLVDDLLSATTAGLSGVDFPSADDPVAILYTSGTTGRPKGAIISHGNVQAQATNYAISFGLTAADRQVMFLPLCFTGGLITASMNTFLVGGSMVLQRTFDPREVLAAIATERATWLIGVPTMFQRIFEHPDAATADLSSLRLLQGGGAAVSPALIDTVHRRGLDLVQGYGITEGTGGLCLLLPEWAALSKAGSAGKPGVLGLARVVREDGTECEVDEVGELCVGGPLVFQGYWRNEQATAETIIDGWLHTGDLARKDAEGFYYIAGRRKEMIISGGLNIYPVEVEQAMAALPEIHEIAVVGVPDDAWGEVVVAYVVVRDGYEPDADSIRSQTRAFLADYKIPKRIYFVADFPRTASNKILKTALTGRAER